METMPQALRVDHLVSMAVFTRVVEQRSVSRAASMLGLSKSMISKRLASLERDLGARLLRRTTRSVALTDAGAALYERSVRMLAAADDAQAAVADVSGRVQGLIRVNAPVTFGQMHVAPAVTSFLAEHPGVQVDLSVSDHFADVVADGYDLVIRMSRLTDSSLTARRLGRDRRVVCASPGYLERHGTPRKPDDLLRHNCLRYTTVAPRTEWRFRTARGVRTVPVTGNLLANNGTILREAALGGLGLANVPEFMVARDLRAGSLRVVLDEYELPPIGIYAVHAFARGVPAKVRALIEFFAVRFRGAV